MAGKLDGKKVLLIICPVNFRDEEFIEPKKILTAEGAAVTTASERPGDCKGMLGAVAKADISWNSARAEDYDAVVVVGGSGSPQYLWDNIKVKELVSAAAATGRVVGAICLSGAVLANAGVLKGLEATVYPTPESKAALARGGAKYLEKDVVISGKVITGVGPQAAAEFGKAIADALR